MSIRAKTKRRVTILLVSVVVVVGAMGSYVLVKKHRHRVYLAEARADGMAAAKRGDYKIACDKLTEYLGLHWDDLDALVVYAQVRPKVEPNDPVTGQREIHALRRILELDPSRTEERHELLELYARFGFVTETAELAKEILETKEHNPNDAKALQYRTAALTRLRDFKTALIVAREWCRVEPMNVRAQMALVSLMNEVKDPALAEGTPKEYAAKLRTLHPGLAEFDLLNGYACALEQDYDNAKKLLREAADLTPPKDGPPDNELAALLVTQLNDLGLYEDSLKVLERVAKAKGNENNKDVIKALARRKWESNRMEEVVELTNGLQINDPSMDNEMMMLRATALLSMKKVDESNAIRTMLAGRKDDIVAMAWVMIMDPKNFSTPDEARRLVNACEKAVKQEPRNTYLRYQLGEAYAAEKETDLAINEWQQVAIENATWYLPLVRLSNLRLDDRNYDLALHAAGEGWRRAQSNPVAVINLAKTEWTSLEAGKLNDADTPPLEWLKPYSMTALRPLVNNIQGQMPGEEHTLPIQVALLAKSGKKAEASDVLRKALAKYNLSESALMQLAQVSHDNGLGLEDECFAKNEQSRGLTPSLTYARALSLYFKGATADGLALMRSAAAKSTTGGDYSWRLLTARYMDVTHDPKAKDEWVSVATAFPDNIVVQQAAMEARASREDRAFMDRTIERVKALAPGEGTRWRLARARWLVASSNSSDWEQAVVLLKQVVDKVPGLIEAKFLLAQCYEHLGNIDGAIQQLNVAATLEPTNDGVALYLARLHTGRGEFEKARQQLDRVAKAAQATPEVRREAALIYTTIGDSARAMETLKNVDVSSEKSELLMAMLYRQRNDLDKADAIVHKLLDKPDAVIVQFAADLFASEGKKDEAAKALEKLDKLELKPGFKELLLADYASRHIGQAESLKDFKAACAAAPTNAMTWRSMIVYCISIGRTDEMTMALTTAVKSAAGDKNLEALNADRDLLAAAASDAQLRGLAVVYAQAPGEQDAARAAIAVVLDGRKASHKPEQIAADLRKLADDHQQLNEVQYLMTRFYMSIGKYDDAASVALRAMQNFPTSPEPAMLAVDALASSNRWTEALDAAKTWRERSSARPLPADMAIGMAYMMLKQPRTATEVLQPYMDAALANPDANMPVLVQYATAQNLAGDVDKSAAMLWPWVQRSAIWRQRWIQLALSREMTKQQAAAWLQRVQDIIPADDIAERSLMGEAWNALGEYAQDPSFGARAEEVLAPLMGKPETPVPAMIIMAVRSESHGKVDDAEALYRKVLVADPNSTIAQNNLAMILSRKDASLDEALDLASKAVKSMPRQGTVWDTLALIQEKKKLYDAALQSLEQALRLEPNSVEWRVHRIEILIKFGHRQEARQVLTEIDALPIHGALIPELQKRLDAVRADLNKDLPKQAFVQQTQPEGL